MCQECDLGVENLHLIQALIGYHWDWWASDVSSRRHEDHKPTSSSIFGKYLNNNIVRSGQNTRRSICWNSYKLLLIAIVRLEEGNSETMKYKYVIVGFCDTTGFLTFGFIVQIQFFKLTWDLLSRVKDPSIKRPQKYNLVSTYHICR